MDLLLQDAFCAFCASYQLSAAYDFFPQWKGGGSLVVADGEQSISLAVCEASQGEKLNMFGWRYPVIPVVCLILFVGYAIRSLAFPVGGTGKILKSLFRLRRVSTWALSVFFVQNSCWGSCRIKDLTMRDGCYQILQGREVSCKKKGGILSDERCRSWSENETRLFAQTRFGRFEQLSHVTVLFHEVVFKS